MELHHVCAVGLRNLSSRVRALRVNDVDFAHIAEGFEATRQIPGFVAGGNDCRHREERRRALFSHLLWLFQLLHRGGKTLNILPDWRSQNIIPECSKRWGSSAKYVCRFNCGERKRPATTHRIPGAAANGEWGYQKGRPCSSRSHAPSTTRESPSPCSRGASNRETRPISAVGVAPTDASPPAPS